LLIVFSVLPFMKKGEPIPLAAAWFYLFDLMDDYSILLKRNFQCFRPKPIHEEPLSDNL
jgi:hypothetical protein